MAAVIRLLPQTFVIITVTAANLVWITAGIKQIFATLTAHGALTMPNLILQESFVRVRGVAIRARIMSNAVQ